MIQPPFSFGEAPDKQEPIPASAASRLMVLGGLTVMILLVGGVLLLTEGKVFIALGVAGVMVAAIVTLYRIDWGFYLLVGLALALDQFNEVPYFESFTYELHYFSNLNAIPYLPSLPSAGFSPFEVHVVALGMVWAFGALVTRQLKLVRIPLGTLIALFVAWVIIGLANGVRAGGNITVAMWELRGLFYMVFMYLFVPQIIRSREQLHTLLWVCIAGITLKAFVGAGRFILLGFTMGGHDTLVNHEEPLLIFTLLAFLGALILFRARTRQKAVLLLLAVPLILGFYSGNRRAAYASMAASLVAFVLMLPWKEALRVASVGGPLIVLLGLYTAVFWDSDSKIATPLKQIKSGFVEDEEVSERNYYSNLYRKIEEYNLAVTLQHSIATGIGFGTKYEQPLALVAITYSLRDYMAHNNVIWLFVKTGVIGFFLFWLLLDGYAARLAGLVAHLQDPYLKAVAVFIVVAVLNQIAAAYFDLHLVRYRTMIYLGLLMGLLPVIEEAAKAAPRQGPAPPWRHHT
jgi:hypothetical protein